MAGINDYDCEGTLSIGGFSMTRPAWTVQANENGAGGLLPLLTTVSVRGTDRILPSAAGVLPFRRRNTVTPHTFRVVVASDVQPNGTASVLTPDAQLVTNLKSIYDNVVIPTGATDGTRTISTTLPGPFTGTGTIHVLEFTLNEYGMGESGAIAIGTLRISIPAGRLTWV